MPLLDHFRWPRFTKPAATPPAAALPAGQAGRLHRVVVRQRPSGLSAELAQTLEALESEYSEPLYDASAYGSPLSDVPEDPSWKG